MSNVLKFIKFLSNKRDKALEEGNLNKVIELADLIEKVFKQYNI